jgi:hypothetical protein
MSFQKFVSRYVSIIDFMNLEEHGGLDSYGMMPVQSSTFVRQLGRQEGAETKAGPFFPLQRKYRGTMNST